MTLYGISGAHVVQLCDTFLNCLEYIFFHALVLAPMLVALLHMSELLECVLVFSLMDEM